MRGLHEPDFWVEVNVSAHLDQSRIVEDRIVGDLIDTDDLKVMREIERIAHRGRDRIRWDWHCLFVLFGILLLMIAFAGNDDTTRSTSRPAHTEYSLNVCSSTYPNTRPHSKGECPLSRSGAP